MLWWVVHGKLQPRQGTCVCVSERITQVRTDIYVTSFGPVSDTEMVRPRGSIFGAINFITTIINIKSPSIRPHQIDPVMSVYCLLSILISLAFFLHMYLIIYFYIIELSRYNLYATQFAHLMWTILWCLACSKNWATVTMTNFRKISSFSPKLQLMSSHFPLPPTL